MEFHKYQEKESEIGKDRVLLKARNVTKWFPIKKGFFEEQKYIRALDDVNLDILIGETLGIVGESGCGKSTLARALLRLIEPTDGSIEYRGKNILQMGKNELREIRRDMQMIFQDPYSSLHPRMKIGEIISEPFIINKIVKDKILLKKQVLELLEMVGLDDSYVERYPHEFSGGQLQRIIIARALATRPKLLICDEPVSALDVSVRAQVLNLFKDLQNELNLTYLFISHDLSVVEHICDKVVIMYLGKIVEIGSTNEIYSNPLHPYTKALFSAIPVIGKTNEDRIILEGDIPNPENPPKGCRFNTRCPYAKEICSREVELSDQGNSHFVACHRIGEI